MRADVAFLPVLASLLNYVTPDHGLDSYGTLISDMLAQEVDFRIEGHNGERFAAIVGRSGRSARSRFADVSVPRVFWPYAREGVIVRRLRPEGGVARFAARAAGDAAAGGARAAGDAAAGGACGAACAASSAA